MSRNFKAIIHSSAFSYCAIALLLAFSFYLFVIDAAGRQLVDLDIYYQSAQHLAQGLNIYKTPVMVQNRWGYLTEGFYLYPPILAYALSLLPKIEYPTIKLLWCGLSWVCIVASAACLASLMQFSRAIALSFLPRFALTLFFTICFEPVYSGISDGQVAGLILLTICSFFLCYAKQSLYAAGAVLGIAASIKITPALLLLVPLKNKHWKVFVAFGLLVLASLALPLFSSNTHVVWDFFDYLQGLSVDARHRDFPFNYAFDKAILLPFGLQDLVTLRWGIKAFVLVLPVALVMRAKLSSTKANLTYLAFVSCCMVLSSPIMWFHHLAWILPAITVFTMNNEHTGKRSLRYFTLAIGYFFAISQTHLIQFQVFMNNPAGLKFTTLVPGVLILTLAMHLLSSPGKLTSD